MNEALLEELRSCDEIEALALGGSRATGNHDESSDYDYYVYLKAELSETKRRTMIDKYVSYMEYSNRFWELEDDGTFKNGVDVEFIYRSIDDLDDMLDGLFNKGYVSHGYTTCFLDNLLRSKIVFDKGGRLESLKDKYASSLDKTLYDSIISYNVPILMDKMPSLFYQIEKAMKRQDQFSVNHRTTAYFEMYFDILFALNQVTHPGEKRLLESASLLQKTPVNMVRDISRYFSIVANQYDEALSLLQKITINLHSLLDQEGYSYPMNSYKQTL